MAIRNDTILQGLQQERARILEALKPIDTKTLQAQLAAIEQTIAIYEPRVTEQAKNRLPKVLNAAKKIRSNNNGNGQHPFVTKKQRRITNMIATLQDPPNGGKNLTVYVNNGYLTKSKTGSYAITAKGKHKLAELTATDDPSA